MTEKERLLTILKKGHADRPACICPGGMMNMVTSDIMEACGIRLPDAHKDAGQMAALAKTVYETGCFENVGVPFCMTVEAEGMGAPCDLGSSTIEPRVTGYVIRSVSEYTNLTPLDLTRGRCRTVLEALSILKSTCPTLPVIGNLTGPISTASSLIEPMVFYRELRKKKEEAHAFLDFVTGELLRYGLAQIRAGADCIAISDPSGTGEILGPRYFEEFAVPCLNRLTDAFREANAGTIVHICGHMDPVYEEAAKIRSHALSFDAVVSMRQAREQLPCHVIMGNISTYSLEFSDTEKIRELTKHCLKNGVDIVAPACGLGMKTPLKNEQAILNYMKEVYHADN